MLLQIHRTAMLLLLVLPLAALAEDSGHIKIIHNLKSFQVAEDYSYTETNDFEYKALTDQGARTEGRLPITYDKSRSTLEILTAETIKADGRHIAVPASAIARQSGILGAFTLKDFEVVSLNWPEFTPGDAAHIVYRLHSKPLLPESFSVDVTPYLRALQDKVEVSIDAPADMPLNVVARDFRTDTDRLDHGHHLLVWSMSVDKTREAEPNQTDARITNPHLWVSSFANWDAMAATYLPLYQAKVAQTPEITRLANELTAGAATDREKARRLYDWIRQNIRYVAIYAGLETWVPHSADQVLQNRFGDCKDHAVLLDAMLRAVGIASYPVLIQKDETSYRLPDIAMPGFFNHMINYLPSLDLYVDTTSPVTEFGILPDDDQGKQVLRAGAGQLLGQTPASTADARQSRRVTSIEIHQDGSATVDTQLWFSGDLRSWYNAFRTVHQDGKANKWATDQLEAQKKRGQAKLTWLAEKDGWQGFEITQTVENFMSEREIGLINFGHAYTGNLSIYSSLDPFERTSRNSSFACRAITLTDTVKVSVPDNLKVLRLPHNHVIDNAVTKFEVQYADTHGVYTMSSSFRWNPGHAGNCQKTDWDAWQQTMRQIRAAAESGVLAYERS